MSIEDNKDLNRRVVEEVLNTGKVELLDEMMTPSVAAHLQRDIPALRQAFPDLHYTIENMVAEGDQVVVRVTMTGTNTGPFQGRPPTGRSARWTGMVLSRCAGGKIVEQWFNLDLFTLMQQLGVIPGGMPSHAGLVQQP
ncbi:MAG TPA: ester cyclase [Chloroflexia bacterium]|nr:ester cyclase [Chloroflexia bacterium]